MRRGSLKIADAESVIKRIHKEVPPNQVPALENKVREYVKTKDNAKDLTNSDANFIYRHVDLDNEEDLTKKRKLDIDWTGHATYRTELRDINPEKVDEMVTERLKSVAIDPKKKKNDKKQFHEPGVGTAIVDYELDRNPADAKIVTVYAKRINRIALRLLK